MDKDNYLETDGHEVEQLGDGLFSIVADAGVLASVFVRGRVRFEQSDEEGHEGRGNDVVVGQVLSQVLQDLGSEDGDVLLGQHELVERMGG